MEKNIQKDTEKNIEKNLQETVLHDRDIREPLFDFLEEHYGKTRFLEEIQMGNSRADIVMVTPDAVCGIEIKSDADTYARLGRQIPDYDLYFDCNIAVVGTSHAQHIKEHVPEWWGIITVELDGGKFDFYYLRKPAANPKMLWDKKIGLLWRPELVHILELNNMPAYKEKSKKFVAGKIVERVSKDILSAQMSEELFQRDYTMIAEEIKNFRIENSVQHPPRRRKKRRRRL